LTSRKSHGKKKNDRNVTPERLISEAASFLERGRFREAIEHYKKLLDLDRNPDWVEGLARAYEGRARELAGKGMFEEALGVWQNRSRICGKPLAQGPYFDWILAAKKMNAGELLRLLSDPEQTDRREEIEKILLLPLFCLPEKEFSALPSGTPFLDHCRLAREALSRFATGQFDLMDGLLGQIPFRSPFSVWKLLLKALSVVGKEPEEAGRILSRIPAGGPFDPLVLAVRTAALPEKDRFSALSALSPEGRQLVLELWGCPGDLVPFASELASPGADTPRKLFSILEKYRRNLPKDLLDAFVPRLLVHMPEKASSLPSLLPGLPSWKIDRIRSLQAEQRGDLDGATLGWEIVAEKLAEAEGVRAGKEVALILRRLGTGLRSNYSPGTDPGQNAKAAGFFKRSLEFDPYDRETLLWLARISLESSDLRSCGQTLVTLLDLSPEDPEVLMLAAEHAGRTGAHKKAIVFCHRILVIDPSNAEVRRKKGRAHLDEARKLIRGDFFPGARKELAAADPLLCEKEDRKRLQLLEALSGAKEGKTSGPLFPGLSGKDGISLPDLFLLAAEAERLNLSREKLLPKADLSSRKKHPARELVDLAACLSEEASSDRSVGSALAFLRPRLEKISLKGLSAEEIGAVCDALLKHGENGLAGKIAGNGLAIHRKDPLLTFLSVLAAAPRSMEELGETRNKNLFVAFQEANSRGDLRTAARITDFMERLIKDQETEGDPEEDRALFDELMADLKWALKAKEYEGIQVIAQNVLGHDTVREVRERFSGNRKRQAEEFVRLIGRFYDLL